MKTICLHLRCKTTADTNSIVSQLNYLKDHKDPESAPFSAHLHDARVKGTCCVSVTLVDCTKKDAVNALKDILKTYKFFEVTGHVTYFDNFKKQVVIFGELPLDVDDEAHLKVLDKINQVCNAKFKVEDLAI